VFLSKRLREPMVILRHAGAFLVTVAVMTTGLLGLLKARAVLDAQAALYYAAQPLDANPPSTVAMPEIVGSIGPKATVSELPRAAVPALPIAVTMTASDDTAAAVRHEQPDEVSNTGTGRDDKARVTALALACPAVGKKQPQHDGSFASRKRPRYQRLAVGGLAQRRSTLRSDAHRMRAFLAYRNVVHYQYGSYPYDIAVADEFRRVDKHLCSHRRCLANPGSNDVVQLIAFADRKPPRYRLYAVAIAKADQSRHVQRHIRRPAL